MLSSTSPVVELAKASFKRAQRGLFGGKHIQFGNNIPFSKTKTRRTWLPNVQTKKLFSETLNEWIRLNMTTSVIRTVDKKGGLDRYLLETRSDLLGEKGMELRSKLVEALKVKQAKRAAEKKKVSDIPASPSSTSAPAPTAEATTTSSSASATL
ncbi:ribosomal L28 family-domain-containing protein [Mortierella sp. GBAus27b]|nr:39S ribosomal protein L24, mitochondrial [Mortierella sp. GBA43]KAI8361291.1 ribosomal L28 family-domain-containing protein [Mortierella sp. GBAus27b]